MFSQGRARVMWDHPRFSRSYRRCVIGAGLLWAAALVNAILHGVGPMHGFFLAAAASLTASTAVYQVIAYFETIIVGHMASQYMAGFEDGRACDGYR